MIENNSQSNQSQTLSTRSEEYERLKDITTLVYVLQTVALLIVVTAIIGVVINYVKRNEVAGMILASHFKWQIRTFWIALPFFVLAGILIATVIGAIIGYPILALIYIWWIYRVVKGWLVLNRGESLYLSE